MKKNQKCMLVLWLILYMGFFGLVAVREMYNLNFGISGELYLLIYGIIATAGLAYFIAKAENRIKDWKKDFFKMMLLQSCPICLILNNSLENILPTKIISIIWIIIGVIVLIFTILQLKNYFNNRKNYKD